MKERPSELCSWMVACCKYFDCRHFWYVSSACNVHYTFQIITPSAQNEQHTAVQYGHSSSLFLLCMLIWSTDMPKLTFFQITFERPFLWCCVTVSLNIQSISFKTTFVTVPMGLLCRENLVRKKPLSSGRNVRCCSLFVDCMNSFNDAATVGVPHLKTTLYFFGVGERNPRHVHTDKRARAAHLQMRVRAMRTRSPAAVQCVTTQLQFLLH